MEVEAMRTTALFLKASKNILASASFLLLEVWVVG